MIRKKMTPRISIDDNGCLPHLKYVEFDKIKCEYYQLCYNELSDKYIYKLYLDNITSYMYHIDNVEYVVDLINFETSNISSQFDVGLKHIIARNLYYRNKRVDTVTIKLNLLERFNNPKFVKETKWISFNDYYLHLIDYSRQSEILGKFKYIINNFIEKNPNIFIYRFNSSDDIDIRIIENIFPNSFQMFKMIDGSLYIIKRIIINDRYCF